MRQSYTVEGANRTLPYVRSIVAEAIERYAKLSDGGDRHNKLAAEELQARKVLKTEIRDHAERLKECQEELLRIGAVLKDPERGLVDFPAEFEARDISLCWEFGEDVVGFWHEADEGFAGRKPVPDGVPEWPAVTAGAARG